MPRGDLFGETMRAVFDFDDTICYHKDRERSVDAARPIELTVDKMRRMKEDGWEIVIYTARGQKSCGGDLAKIEAKYRSVIEDWLARYEVPYDELLGSYVIQLQFASNDLARDWAEREGFPGQIKPGSSTTVIRMD